MPSDRSGVLASTVARRRADAPAADVAALTAGDAAFGAELLALLGRRDGGNLAVSPLSIRLALAMAYAGARGETAAQMAQVLRYDLSEAALHAAFNRLDRALEELNRSVTGDGGVERRVVISVSNALWGQAGLDVEAAYLDTLAAEYGAGMRLVDFAGAAEAARATINSWVARETSDRIPELIPAGVLTAEALLVLTNTVYLFADWALPFPSGATADGPFTRLDGSQATVPFMHRTLAAAYAAGDGWQAIDLGYVGGEMAMLLVLPDEGRLDEVATSATLFSAAREALGNAEVRLALPRFEFRTRASLPDALRTMGVTDAFDAGRADFTGIVAGGGLFVSDVIHEVFVAVDEAGTEAAAATAVVIARGGLPREAVDLAFDRPFLFWLYDRATGTILFMGRVLDPSA